MIIPSQRDLFDLPRYCVYLNAAYMTPFTHKMETVACKAAEQLKKPWEYVANSYFDDSESCRGELADLLGVSAENMAMTPSASYGAATAARNMCLSERESILLLEGQFPSNVYEWDVMAKDKGGRIVFVPTPDDNDWTNAILATIAEKGEQIAFAALPNVHWSNGAMIDLPAVSSALKTVGAGLVLDLTQSWGAMPTDIGAIDPDFAFASGYKWLLGPYSSAILYVADRHLAGRSLEQNWISRKDSDDFARLVHYRDEYLEGARRFDVGERSNFLMVPLIREATRQISTWGIDNIAETLRAKNTEIADIFSRAGYTAISADLRAPHILGIDVGLEAGEEMMPRLKAAGVVASLRGNMLRISPHLWTDTEDLGRLDSALKNLN